MAASGYSTPAAPPPPTQHTPSTSTSPNATSQFEAWLRCRKEGVPARLVLETDGVSEEVCLWVRRTARAPTEATPPRRRRRRPGRDKERRQRRAERERAARSNAPPAPAEVAAGAAPSTADPVDLSPPAKSPPAKRPRTRAAARGGGRPDPPTPESARSSMQIGRSSRIRPRRRPYTSGMRTATRWRLRTRSQPIAASTTISRTKSGKTGAASTRGTLHGMKSSQLTARGADSAGNGRQNQAAMATV